MNLLSDSPLGLKPRKSIAKFHNFITQDPFGAIDVYKKIADHLANAYENTQGGTICTIDLSLFKGTPVFKEALYLHRSYAYGSVVFKWLLQFATVAKKSPFIGMAHLEEAAVAKWLATEERLKSLILPDDILPDLKKILETGLEGYVKHFLPKHGSGTVSDVPTKLLSDKNASMTRSPFIDRWYLTGTCHLSGVYIDWKRLYPEAVAAKTEDFLPDETPDEALWVSKTASSLRSICRTTAEKMYWQQSTLYSLTHAIRRSFMYQSITIDDQTLNQRLARHGSLTGTIVTLDQSEASDSVSWSLVRRIFPWQIVREFAATRARTVDVKGSVYHISKFAPMGSAVCFPVQCLIFYAVILREYIRYYGLEFTRTNIIWAAKSRLGDVAGLSPIGVYGDDLCFDERVADQVIDALTRLGFIINNDKSFRGSKSYRESCGKHYLNGIDVTPIIPRLKTAEEGKRTPVLVLGLVALANEMYDRDYNNTRNYVISVIHHGIPWWTNDNERFLPYRYGKHDIRGPRPHYYNILTETRSYSDKVRARWAHRYAHLEYVFVTPLVRTARWIKTLEVRRFKTIIDGVETHHLVVCDKDVTFDQTEHVPTSVMYMRDEERVVTVATEYREVPKDNVYEYLQWMRSPENENELPLKDTRCSLEATQSFLQWNWVPRG